MLPPLLIAVVILYGVTAIPGPVLVLLLCGAGVIGLGAALRRIHERDNAATLERVNAELTALLERHNIPADHGIGHARAVLGHAREMVKAWSLSPSQRLAVLLAALLHDADDRKLFPAHHNYDNARMLLRGVNAKTVELVVRCIALVSTAKNGDTVPDGTPGWLLIPRLADRLEAIGYIGVVRCLEYTLHVGRPLFTEMTVRARDEADLWSLVATRARYQAYCGPGGGKSDSFIDHMYDKLLHLLHNVPPAYGEYVIQLARERRTVMVALVLEFGRRGTITEADVAQFVSERTAG